jgi:hypothetical protein
MEGLPLPPADGWLCFRDSDGKATLKIAFETTANDGAGLTACTL